tara:strand:+ start:246 stop:461 length:216 start_codon:yes stop_codon:yes gene_type:complete
MYFEKRFDFYREPKNSRHTRRGNRFCTLYLITYDEDEENNQELRDKYNLHLCIEDEEGNKFKSEEYKVLIL